jgi:hypothetical protein
LPHVAADDEREETMTKATTMNHGWSEAYRLAAAHSHAWAYAWADACEEIGVDALDSLALLPPGRVLASLEAAYEAAAEKNLGAAGLRPTLVHTTASGRVQWQCDDDGGWIDVYRPVQAGLGGRVCVAHLRWWKTPAYAGHEVLLSTDQDGPGELFGRHVDALRVCADALGITLADPPRVTPDPEVEE